MNDLTCNFILSFVSDHLYLVMMSLSFFIYQIWKIQLFSFAKIPYKET